MPSCMIVIVAFVAAILLLAVTPTVRHRRVRARRAAAEADTREARVPSDSRHGEGGGSAMTASWIRSGGSM